MTKRMIIVWVSVIVLTSFALTGNSEGISIDAFPPSVVKTIPLGGDTNVDPNIRQVEVTFSREMMTNQMWSWCSQSPDTFPEINAKGIRFLKDKRTCVLPVKLKPGKTYAVWINTQKFQNFKDASGKSAVPYLLVFQTR